MKTIEEKFTASIDALKKETDYYLVTGYKKIKRLSIWELFNHMYLNLQQGGSLYRKKKLYASVGEIINDYHANEIDVKTLIAKEAFFDFSSPNKLELVTALKYLNLESNINDMKLDEILPPLPPLGDDKIIDTSLFSIMEKFPVVLLEKVNSNKINELRNSITFNELQSFCSPFYIEDSNHLITSESESEGDTTFGNVYTITKDDFIYRLIDIFSKGTKNISYRISQRASNFLQDRVSLEELRGMSNYFGNSEGDYLFSYHIINLARLETLPLTNKVVINNLDNFMHEVFKEIKDAVEMREVIIDSIQPIYACYEHSLTAEKFDILLSKVVVYAPLLLSELND